MTVRISRTRPALPLLKNEFEINFKLEVVGPGITAAEAEAYVTQCMKYASAAYAFEVTHPTGDNDPHSRDRISRCGGAENVKAM